MYGCWSSPKQIIKALREDIKFNNQRYYREVNACLNRLEKNKKQSKSIDKYESQLASQRASEASERPNEPASLTSA